MTMHPPLVISVEGDSAPSPSQSSFKKLAAGKCNPIVRQTDDVETRRSGERRISFGKRVKIKKIRSHKLYTEAERNAVWHNEEEMAAIKKGCIRTLREMMKYSFQESEECCPRGLEVRAKEASIARKQVRALAAQIVFDEQDLQMDCGIKDDERIRKSYLDISRDAHSRARDLGLSDAQAIKKYISGSC